MSLRTEFEAFYRDHMSYDECERVEVIESTIDSYNEDRDRYGYSDIQELWLSWKASRAALCIVLPKTPDFSASDEPDLAFEYGVDVMKDLIEAKGVTVK